MKLQEIQLPSDRALRESIERDNDTGISNDVLFSIARTDRDNRWVGLTYEEFMAEFDAMTEDHDNQHPARH